MSGVGPTQRFSSRVENYVRYRPGYPRAIVRVLERECGLTPACVVADVGSGTGLLTELFLAHGNRVFGVEPNPEMRAAGEHYLRAYRHFTSVAGSAEATTLPESSVDFVTAGQALHWFDRPQARREFTRVLKPGGHVALVWNERRPEASAFAAAYEDLLARFGTDATPVVHRRVDDEAIAAFFRPGRCELRRFEHAQTFDLEGLQGRLLSSSYTPEVGHPDHEPMLRELRALFAAHQAAGTVRFDYLTKLYFGRLRATA
jgi:ubiquinone/menaquinone biosynthesis C-methylase UbiE